MTKLHVEIMGSGTPVMLVHGSFATPAGSFAGQKPLSDAYELRLVERRGYGRSVAGEEELGWAVDAEDLAELLDESGPAHLVGHSYGAISCLMAAGLRPERVLSLVAIEPPVFTAASDDADAARVAGVSKAVAERASELDRDEFMREWGATVGLSRFEVAAWTEGFTADDWSNADASKRERWPGDAEIPYEVLAGAAFPKVLARGGWNPEQVGRKAQVGAAFGAVCNAIADRTGGRVVRFANSTHNPQSEEASAFNELLREVWQGS